MNEKDQNLKSFSVKIRNRTWAPDLDPEGMLICPLPAPKPAPPGEDWDVNLKPYERLYYHQTLSSVRYSNRFMPTCDIPKDSLDFQLQSRYHHGRESFPDKVDMLLQRETCTPHTAVKPVTYRVLRNSLIITTPAPDKQLPNCHPLTIGGLTAKRSPHSVELIPSGPHNQFVNNGYSRQESDGNFFRY